MKIKDIIIERHVPLTVAHDPEEAEKKFLDANKGKAGKSHDAKDALKRVRSRYDMEILDDEPEKIGHPGKKVSDKRQSILSKDNRC